MKKVLFLFAVFAVLAFASYAQSPQQDYSGLLKTVTMTNAQTDSTLVTIPGSRTAVTFKYDIVKTSGAVAGTITLQYKLTTLGAEQWFTYNTYTLTDSSANVSVPLAHNPALKWKVLVNTTGSSVSTHRIFLLYRR